MTPKPEALLQFASPQAAEYGEPEDTERRVGERRKLETEKRIGNFRVNRKVAWGIFISLGAAELGGLLKLAFLSAVAIAALLVLWWVLAAIGLPIPPPPIDLGPVARAISSLSR